MIDRLLEKHLKPIARDQWRWHLWRGLAACWAVMAGAGVGLIVLHRLTGWWAAWLLPSLIAVAAGWALFVWLRWRRLEPDYRQIARQIERKRRLHNAEMENQQKLWRWLIVAALAVLLVETCLAGWLTRRATVGATTPG